jgi:Enoyl-(Acyl carrier protein) reductase
VFNATLLVGVTNGKRYIGENSSYHRWCSRPWPSLCARFCKGGAKIILSDLNEAGTAEDIANLGVFLASDEGSFINNQVILCDGGNAMRGFRI